MRSDGDGMRDLAGAFGTQVVRIEEAGQISRIDDWVHDAYLEDAVEMIDRLAHHAEILSLKGDSYRLRDKDLGSPPPHE